MTWSPQQDAAAQWKPVPGWPYEVCNYGEVRNARTGRLLKQDTARGGYKRVTFSSGGNVKRFMVNRLVCEVFNGPPPSPDHHARHRDGISSHNSASNLLWGTRSENEQDKRRHGTFQAREKNPFAKLTKKDVSAIRVRYAANLARRQSLGFQKVQHGLLISLAEEMNVSVTCIKFVVYERNWSGQQ
jgi:hypothetical protein